MSRITWITIVVLMLLCAIGAWISTRSVPSERGLPAPELADASREDAGRAAPLPDGVVVAREAVAEEVVHIRGRVILPPGTPHDEDVRVGAFPGSGESTWTAQLPSRLAADGSFDLEVPRSWDWTELRVMGRYLFDDSDCFLGLEEEIPFQELRPLLGARIEGTLLGAVELGEQAPDTSGFEIELRTAWIPESYCTGHAARMCPPAAFVIDAVSADCTYELRIDILGFQSQVLPVEQLVPGQTTRVVVPLVHVATVRGTIITREGTPVAAAQIRPYGDRLSLSPRPNEGTRTLADGTFALSGLGPGTPKLLVSHPDHPGRVVALAPLYAGETREGVRIVLDDFARLEGDVVDESGRGIPFSHVVITDLDRPDVPLWDWDRNSEVGTDWEAYLARTPAERWHNSIMGLTTDEHGWFDCDRLACGRVLVTAWHDSRLNRTPIAIELVAQQKAAVHLELRAGTYLYVLLEGDPSPARPAASIRVLDRQGMDYANQAFPVSAAMRIRPKAGLKGVPVGPLLRGSYRVSAVHKDGRNAEEEVTVSGLEPLQVTLRFGGTGK